MYQQEAISGVREVDVSSWGSGIYIMNVVSNQQLYVQKLIVK